jgi:hypothetical protein
VKIGRFVKNGLQITRTISDVLQEIEDPKFSSSSFGESNLKNRDCCGEKAKKIVRERAVQLLIQ